MAKYNKVLFFERNQEGTFTLSNQTEVLTSFEALQVYANTKNPASQLVGADDITSLVVKVGKVIDNMSNLEYVEKSVNPYL